MAVKKRIIILFSETAYSSGSSLGAGRGIQEEKVSLFSRSKFFYDDALTIQKYFEYYNGPFSSKLPAALH